MTSKIFGGRPASLHVGRERSHETSTIAAHTATAAERNITSSRYRGRVDDATHRTAAMLLGVCALAASACSRPAVESPSLNVLLISIDSLRADHVGAYGYPRETTPTLDRLAAEGIRFANAFSTTSWTLPAHAALLTGLLDSRHGATVPTASLDESATTLAEVFRDAGYRTVGFYSGPFVHPIFGFGRGFEEYIDCTSYDLGGFAVPASAKVHASSQKDITNPRIAARFAQSLQRHDGRPFFYFVHMWDVHYELVPPPPYDRMFTGDTLPTPRAADFRHDPHFAPGMDDAAFRHVIGLYDGEIRFTDDTISRLLAELRRRGLLEKTLVVVTSDHGDEFLDHGGKGHRRTLFHEVLQVPLVFWAPGLLPPAVASTTASLVDVAPTILEIAGLPDMAGIDGAALVDRSGNILERSRIAIAEVRMNPHRPKLAAAISHPHKVIRDFKVSRDSYYDLERDPGETAPMDAGDVEAAKPLRDVLDTTYKRAAAASSGGPRPPARPLPPAMTNRLRELGYLD